jgi:hypothetical protein
MNTNLMNVIMHTFDKGAASVVISFKSADSDMNKGRGANRNPFYGRTDVKAVYSGFVMGTDYTNSLTNTANRMGEEVSRDDVRLRETWHRPIKDEEANIEGVGRWFSTDKKTATKCYLKLQRNEQQKGFKVTKTYYVDGREATAEEVEAIKVWLKKDSNDLSATQRELGIDKEHKQHFILVTLENILHIQQNERTLRPYEVAAAAYAVAAAV